MTDRIWVGSGLALVLGQGPLLVLQGLEEEAELSTEPHILNLEPPRSFSMSHCSYFCVPSPLIFC